MILTSLAYRNDIHIKHPLRWWNEAEVDGVSRDPQFPASGHRWQKLLLHSEERRHQATRDVNAAEPVSHACVTATPDSNVCVPGGRPVTLTSMSIWSPHLVTTTTSAPWNEHLRHPNLPPHPCRYAEACSNGLPQW